MLTVTLSRSTLINIVWTLDKESFNWTLILHELQIGLFAISHNHQLTDYIAPVLDDKAMFINTLTVIGTKRKNLSFSSSPFVYKGFGTK